MPSHSNQPVKTQTIEVRKGQVPEKMSREAFRERFMARFCDPAFRAEDDSLKRLEAIAWDAYSNARKSPITEKAGPGFADPITICQSNGVPRVSASRRPRSGNRIQQHAPAC